MQRAKPKNAELYALNLSDEEYKRLDLQHASIKASFGDRNYIATCPLQQALGATGNGKTLLDIGAGTGIWAIEMGLDFPDAKIIGIDIALPEASSTRAPNVEFLEGNAMFMPFKASSIDVVHLRLLLGGIRDWPGLFNEIYRVLKPGGLVYSVDTEQPWSGVDAEGRKGMPNHPGYLRVVNAFARGLAQAGFRLDCGSRLIPGLLQESSRWSDPGRDLTLLPFWPYSTDPTLRKAGEVGRPHAWDMPEAGRSHMVDTVKLCSHQEYDQLMSDWHDSFGKEDAHSGAWLYHNWAFKI